jgi:hypothetical protein
VLWKRLAVLVAAAMMVLTMFAASAFAAPPDCAGPGLNCGASLEHRANPSGKGNFGQCARIAGGGSGISEFNPSSQNTGECEARVLSGPDGPIELVSIALCAPPSEPFAELQVTFRPLEASGTSGCLVA